MTAIADAPVSDMPFALVADNALEVVGDGIRRRMLAHGPDLMLCLVEFDTGAVGSVHQHPHRQATYVQSGRFRAQVGGLSRELGPGDSLVVGADTEHGVTCLEEGVLIDAFTPARIDFLQQEKGS